MTSASSEGTDGLEYYLLSDGTYGVKAGTTYYLEDIVIPATYNGKDVTQILDNAFDSAPNLTSITIPDTVTYIGDLAFNECSNLTNAIIPEGLVHIGDSAFNQCSNLASAISLKDIQTIGNASFGGCTNLTVVDIDENAPLKSIGSKAFTNSGVEEITIPASIQSIGAGLTHFSQINWVETVKSTWNFTVASVTGYISDDTGVVATKTLTSVELTVSLSNSTAQSNLLERKKYDSGQLYNFAWGNYKIDVTAGAYTLTRQE